MDEKHWVIVGLGNPGKNYEMTRHNIGFLVVQAFACRQGVIFKEEKALHSLTAKGKLGESVIHLLQPTTFMNLSGIAVRSYLQYYRLGPKHLVVVVDDVAIPYGQMRLRLQGGDGGHNGLRNVTECLGTSLYARLRMGISDHRSGESSAATLADYVLDRFTQEESNGLDHFIGRGVEVLQRLMTEDVNTVMNSVNKPCTKI